GRVLLMPPVPYSYRGIRLEDSLRPPSATHPMGTDALGRDLLARVLHGARLSIVVGFGATALALFIGFCFGALAGLRGGLVDLVIVRLLDVVACSRRSSWHSPSWPPWDGPGWGRWSPASPSAAGPLW